MTYHDVLFWEAAIALEREQLATIESRRNDPEIAAVMLAVSKIDDPDKIKDIITLINLDVSSRKKIEHEINYSLLPEDDKGKTEEQLRAECPEETPLTAYQKALENWKKIIDPEEKPPTP
jgi:hypothetical protein